MSEKNIKELSDENSVDGKDQEPTSTHRPWQPARVLGVPAKFREPGFRYRWVSKSKPGNYNKKIQEHWIPAKKVMERMIAANYIQEKTIQDGIGHDTTFQMREMILMKMPESMAKEREKYYERKNGEAQDDAQKHYEDQLANRSYGKISYKK